MTMIQTLLTEVGFALLALALLLYSGILKRLLEEAEMWELGTLPLIGGAMLIIFVIGDMTAYLIYAPNIGAEVDAQYGFWMCQMVSFTSILVAGMLSTIAGLLYSEWLSKQRRTISE